jgi:flagellar protein FlaJ
MDRRKKVDNFLPFATLYLSTAAGTKLTLDKIFKIFSRFSGYKEIVREIDDINNDIENFGIDIYTALERGADRSPSKKLKEVLYGVLSTLRSGGNLYTYLTDKSEALMNDYRRKLVEFSRSLTVYTEIYLTAVVLGGIFFTILTAIISGIGGAPSSIIGLQFLIVFVFIPAISWVFITLIKSATPGEE